VKLPAPPPNKRNYDGTRGREVAGILALGASLFVLSSITGEKIERITASMWPFVIAEVAVLFLVAYWPRMTLSVPALLGL